MFTRDIPSQYFQITVLTLGLISAAKNFFSSGSSLIDLFARYADLRKGAHLERNAN